MNQPKRPSRADRRRIPSGIPGINWLAPSTEPVPALSGTLDDGTRVTLTQWEIAATATLMALWAGDGVLRLSASGWHLAQQDVAYGHEWTLFIEECGGPNDHLLLTLQDTRVTEPARIALIDVTDTAQGAPRVGHSYLEAPAAGLSGDADTDQHLAIMLCMMRANGGILPGRASAFIATARVIQAGHQWRAIPGTGNDDTQLFYLSEPHGPPQPPTTP